ncbi:MAG: polysaccharide deacetylase family protein [Candidatus Zixiibacteriota bacterium]
MKCVFTVDVEDWFHILDTPAAPSVEAWESLPSIVEKNTHRLLDVFDEFGITATFYFLGWIAGKYPQLVKDVHARGHEVASHGYCHRLVYTMSRDEFVEDTKKTKAMLEDCIGEKVRGYRAAGFSATNDIPWFFDVLAEAGYEHDSSVFPAARAHGGQARGRREPHRISTQNGSIWEFPISVAPIFGKPICLFGGGYFRLFPYWMIRQYGNEVLADERPIVFYLHPRELDRDAPRLAMPLYRRFKSYVNLSGVDAKLRRLLTDFEFTTIPELMAEYNHE